MPQNSAQARTPPPLAMCVALALLTLWPTGAQARPARDSGGAQGARTATLVCEASYLPARSTWRRTVGIQYDQRTVKSVAIDGVPVYSFQVNGTAIFTALDGERIQIDTGTLHWSSRFREAATSQGRCEWQK